MDALTVSRWDPMDDLSLAKARAFYAEMPEEVHAFWADAHREAAAILDAIGRDDPADEEQAED